MRHTMPLALLYVLGRLISLHSWLAAWLWAHSQLKQFNKLNCIIICVSVVWLFFFSCKSVCIIIIIMIIADDFMLLLIDLICAHADSEKLLIHEHLFTPFFRFPDFDFLFLVFIYSFFFDAVVATTMTTRSSETGDANSLGVKIRRNSTASSPSEKEKVYENQQSDYKSRR